MSSNLPNKHTRKYYLNQLINSIYGNVKVNYDDYDSPPLILIKSGLADKTDFSNLEKMSRKKDKIKKLFKYTFLDSDTEFKLKDSSFSKQTAINNAVGYFTQFEIDLNEYSPDLSLEALIFNCLSLYVLTAIFDVNSDSTIDQIDCSTENIEDWFKSNIERVRNYVLQQFAFSTNHSDLDSNECYYDKSFFNYSGFKTTTPYSKHLGECNYAIPITVQEVFGLPELYPIKINIPFGPRTAPTLTKEEFFLKLVKGYIPINSSEHHVPSYNNLFIRDNSLFVQPVKEYNLSNVELNNESEKKTIYFLTRIDQSILESIYIDNPTKPCRF